MQIANGENTTTAATARMGIGWLLAAQQDATARVEFLAALTIYRQNDSRLGIANALQALALLDVGESKFQDARRRLDEALEIYKSIGNTMGRGIVIERLGTLAREEGDTDLAKKQFEEAAAIFEEMNLPLAQAYAMLNRGYLEQIDRNTEAARESLLMALTLSRQQHNVQNQVVAAWMLSNLERNCGRRKMAAEYQELVARLTASLGSAEGCGAGTPMESVGE